MNTEFNFAVEQLNTCIALVVSNKANDKDNTKAIDAMIDACDLVTDIIKYEILDTNSILELGNAFDAIIDIFNSQVTKCIFTEDACNSFKIDIYDILNSCTTGILSIKELKLCVITATNDLLVAMIEAVRKLKVSI